MYTEEDLSFAYKYPFSKEAKDITNEWQRQNHSNPMQFADLGKHRVEDALQSQKLEYKNIKYGKIDYIIGYAYARILVSAIGNELAIRKYAAAEAARSKEAIESSSVQELERLARELNIDITLNGSTFAIRFNLFLRYAPKRPEFSISNFGLNNGFVSLDMHALSLILQSVMEREIKKGLPIKTSEIPKIMLAYAKEIKVPKIEIKMGRGSRTFAWIEHLLNTPIPDVRHRTVNLILAPYLVNVKGLDEETAAQVILKYIERCKELDANTKINETYIRYQCKYAKKKGLRPLSISKAKDLVGKFIDFELERE